MLDISERKRAEAERDCANEAQRVLHRRFELLDQVSVTMNGVLATERTSVDAVLGAMAELALPLLHAQRAAIKLAEGVFGGKQVVRTSADASYVQVVDVSVPLRFAARTLGVLTITCDAASRQSLADVCRTLELLAERAGLALEIVRLNQAEAWERLRLETLTRADRELAGTTDLESAFDALARACDLAVPSFARCAALFVHEPPAGLRLIHALHRQRRRARVVRALSSALASGLERTVLTSKQTASVGQPLDAPLARIARALGVQRLVAVPMVARDQVVGVMCFGRVEEDAPPKLVEALEALAAACAATLDVARVLEQLRTAVASRETLLAMVSHDLRSPLNAISLTARALAPLPTQRERRRSAPQLDLIQRSVSRMGQLVEDLLTAANIDAGHFAVAPTHTCACELVDEACQMNQPLFRAKQITLRCAPSTETLVRADRGRVLQVLTNLLVNAAKFTPAQGTVIVRAELADEQVRFSVCDTGPGIAAHALSQVFTRYWTGRARGGGLGLGLYIAERIVQAHEGRIWVESTQGKGATFHFTLPCVATRASEGTPETPEPRALDAPFTRDFGRVDVS